MQNKPEGKAAMTESVFLKKPGWSHKPEFVVQSWSKLVFDF
jgi:hypothetical protein